MAKTLDNKVVKETKLYSEAVSLTGYGKFNLYILLATGGCLMCVIVETMCMSFVMPAAQCDLNLSLGQKGILTSIGYLGVIFTSFFWGFMADAKGRKKILVSALVSSSLVSLVCSIAPWAWLLILLRFVNGALIGGASSIIYAFAGEYHDDRYRPMVISWISSFVAGGQMYIPGMAWLILPQEWSYDIEGLGITFRPWRLLLIVYAVPSLVVAAMLSILPESPKFLLSQGQHDETLKILTKMFVMNTGKKAHEYPVSKIILDEVQTSNTGEEIGILRLLWRQTSTLFGRQYIFKTILICYMQLGVFLSASALALWFPEILNVLAQYSEKVTSAKVTLCGYFQDETVTVTPKRFVFNIYEDNTSWRVDNNVTVEAEVCNDSVDTGVFLVVLLIGAAIGITYIIIGILINRVGKKLLLVGVTFATAVCGLIAQYITGQTAVIVLSGIYLLISACIGIVNAFAVDLYPTNIRAMALAISLMFGRFGAMIGSNLVGIIFYNYCQYLFIIFAANHLILIITSILLPTPKKMSESILEPLR